MREESLRQYVVMNGDMKSSRKIRNRFDVQERLKNAIEILNKDFKDSIVAGFKIVSGDSFQGMLSSSEHLMDIYYVLFENIEYPFYFGIGIGDISTTLSNNIEEIDGKAFYLALDALEEAKRRNFWVIIKSDLKDNDVISCLFNFIAERMWGWSKRQREIVLYYRKHGEHSDTIKSAAMTFAVSERSIYKTLSTARYSLLEYAESVLRLTLNQKRFKNKIEPKTVQK
jgi:hypothetical protein